MTPLLRTAHKIAVPVQAIAAAGFIWGYSATGEGFFGVMAGWCIAYGAWSFTALRAEKRVRA
jgi:hypothetical protein